MVIAPQRIERDGVLALPAEHVSLSTTPLEAKAVTPTHLALPCMAQQCTSMWWLLKQYEMSLLSPAPRRNVSSCCFGWLMYAVKKLKRPSAGDGMRFTASLYMAS